MHAKATIVNGVPRKKSVYRIARPRNGFAPRPGNPLTMAMSSASTSTSASAITIMWTLIRKPDQMSGSACRNANGSANAWRTRCTPRPRLLEDGDLRHVDREPLLLQLRDRPVLRERANRGRHVRRQLRSLRHHSAVLLVRDDLAGDGTVRRRLRLLLRRDDRHVHDECVTASDLKRREGRRGLREDLDVRRVQLVLRVVEAGRRRLCAEADVLEVGEAVRGGAALLQEYALVGVEVRRREVDHPRACGGDRRLLEREVERLRAGAEQRLPRDDLPGDLRGRNPELRGDRLPEVDLVPGGVDDGVAAQRADLEADGGRIEPDDELAGMQGRR